MLFASVFMSLCQYLKYSTLAANIDISREINRKYVQHGDEITVTYKISNTSIFALPNFIISDIFDGTLGECIFSRNSVGLRAWKAIKQQKAVKCNSGTGDKTFSKVILSFSDSLGLCRYNIEIDLKNTILILPKIKNIIPFDVSPQPYSTSFGMYDINKSGDAMNFIGIKQYQNGDPVKKINWKLSQKNQNLVINEFEQNANADLLIFMDMHSEIHSGEGAFSTWEYAKDIALSLASNNTNLHNNVQVITNNKIIDRRKVSYNDKLLELEISKMQIEFDRNYSEIYKKIFHCFQHGTNFFYITPLLPSKKILDHLDQILKIKDKASGFTFIGINPDIFIKKVVQEKDESEEENIFLQNTFECIEKFQKEVIPVLVKYGMKVCIVSVNPEKELANSFELQIGI